MVHRKIESTIIEMLKYFRVVAINGPRQSGKTTLQKKISKLNSMEYFTFDDVNTYTIASENTQNFITNISKDNNVAIDEVQMVPNVIPVIKIEKVCFY